MPLVVGIDEAGYGPLLGPLVVAATLWRVRPDAVSADWWHELSAIVSHAAQRGGTRLPVGDSKKIFDRKRGLWTLERSVLAFARAAGLHCQTLADWLRALGCDATSAADVLPWYRDLSCPLPVDPAHSAFEGAAQKLTATMEACGIVCCGARTVVLTENAFNRRVAQTRNKASVLMEAVLRLVQWATEQAQDQDLYVYADRQGGRADYRPWLLPAFPERHLHVQAVDDDCSRYRLASQTCDWHVEFLVGGEQRHLAIALASMLAKYVRELLMERFNAYWRLLLPTVRETAGYYTDAQRFLADIKGVLPAAALRPEQFVRAR